MTIEQQVDYVNGLRNNFPRWREVHSRAKKK